MHSLPSSRPDMSSSAPPKPSRMHRKVSQSVPPSVPTVPPESTPSVFKDKRSSILSRIHNVLPNLSSEIMMTPLVVRDISTLRDCFKKYKIDTESLCSFLQSPNAQQILDRLWQTKPPSVSMLLNYCHLTHLDDISVHFCILLDKFPPHPQPNSVNADKQFALYIDMTLTTLTDKFDLSTIELSRILLLGKSTLQKIFPKYQSNLLIKTLERLTPQNTLFHVSDSQFKVSPVPVSEAIQIFSEAYVKHYFYEDFQPDVPEGMGVFSICNRTHESPRIVADFLLRHEDKLHSTLTTMLNDYGIDSKSLDRCLKNLTQALKSISIYDKCTFPTDNSYESVRSITSSFLDILIKRIHSDASDPQKTVNESIDFLSKESQMEPKEIVAECLSHLDWITDFIEYKYESDNDSDKLGMIQSIVTALHDYHLNVPTIKVSDDVNVDSSPANRPVPKPRKSLPSRLLSHSLGNRPIPKSRKPHLGESVTPLSKPAPKPRKPIVTSLAFDSLLKRPPIKARLILPDSDETVVNIDSPASSKSGKFQSSFKSTSVSSRPKTSSDPPPVLPKPVHRRPPTNR